MTPLHRLLDDAARDKAALHALDLLPANEAAIYEAHLSECIICRDEVRGLRNAASDLALVVPEVAPPASLRARVLDRALRTGIAGSASDRPGADERAQTWKSWPASKPAGEFSFALAKEAVWEPTDFQGVEARRLFVDTANDRATMLVRMAAGTAYPRHLHAGAEECFVLEGDILVGATRMHAGDYQRAEGGSIHGVQSTENGCLLLIVTSLHDELIPPTAR